MDDYQRYKMNEPSDGGTGCSGGNGCLTIIVMIIFFAAIYLLTLLFPT